MTRPLNFGFLLFNVLRPGLSEERVFDIHVHLWNEQKSVEEYLSQLEQTNQELNVGVDNVLLGSDYPQFSLKDMVDALERLDLDETEKDKIRFQNAQRLLRLSPPRRLE